jgi:hypothetical protein
MTSCSLVLLLVACSSAPVATKTPVISVKQVSAPQPQRGVSAPVPVDFNVEVMNPLDEPVTLTSLEIESVGESGGYSMKRVRHSFSIIIKSQDTAVVPIRAWVQPLQQNDNGDVAGGVNVRGIATFASSSGALKTAFATRVK